jgi:sorbitol-specific phosphotransferase system component IIBC
MTDYKAVKVTKGRNGWGGPLVIKPTDDRPLIYSVTGGGIHPVAQRIADLTGGEAFDGFRSSAPFDKVAVAVIDCGGTARIGVYPMKNVLTIDINAATPSGPLANFIKETNFVSHVSTNEIEAIDQ